MLTIYFLMQDSLLGKEEFTKKGTLNKCLDYIMLGRNQV